MVRLLCEFIARTDLDKARNVLSWGSAFSYYTQEVLICVTHTHDHVSRVRDMNLVLSSTQSPPTFPTRLCLSSFSLVKHRRGLWREAAADKKRLIFKNDGISGTLRDHQSPACVWVTACVCVCLVVNQCPMVSPCSKQLLDKHTHTHGDAHKDVRLGL